MYRLTAYPHTVERIADGALIPTNAPDNVDCAQYLAWLEAGNTPEPAPAPDIQAIVVAAVQQRLDDFARTRGYDGILSAATYATSTVPKFAAEGQYAVEARDAHWAKCYEITAEVQAGQSPMPTLAEVLAEMPALEWPQ